MAMSSKFKTIQPHLEIIPNRYELARAVMLRTRQLIEGSPIKKGVDHSLRPTYRSPFSNSTAPKIALDEIRIGAVTIERINKYPKPLEGNADIVFQA